MENSEVYTLLDGTTPNLKKREVLKEFLKKQITAQKQQPSLGEHIAYDIAGLLSTRFIRSLPDDDPYVAILDLAAALELPPHHHTSDETWEALEAAIDKLD